MTHSYRELIDGVVAGPDGLAENLSEAKGQKYTWDNINTAMSVIGFGPKVIVKLLSAINKVVRDKVTVNPKLQEMTVAGTGVGKYSPPLGMAKRGKFSSVASMSTQFDQCARTMGRDDMLKQCRRLGLSLGHLKDDDIRKTLVGMSVRNKRKFVGD